MSAEHSPQIAELLRQQEEIQQKLIDWKKEQQAKKIKEQEIAELLKQQEEIQQKLDEWKKEQEAKKSKEQEMVKLIKLQEEIQQKLNEWKDEQKEKLNMFVQTLGKKRAFTGLSYHQPPKRLKRCFHNIKIIQKKEEDLAKERAQIKEECIRNIKNYVQDIQDLF